MNEEGFTLAVVDPQDLKQAKEEQMDEIIQDIKRSLNLLTGELENFQEIAKYIKPEPGEVPEVTGIDVHGLTLPLNGVIGGDHIIYLDFKKRYDLKARIRDAKAAGQTDVVARLEESYHKAGIALADVSGHQITDALLAAMLHQAFLTGAIYEMDLNGHLSEHLFENLNTRFYNSSSVGKFLTMIYGEIWEDGTFLFISAGHPMPIIFSQKFDRIVDVHEDRLTRFLPIGTLPSENDIDRKTNKSVLGFEHHYEVNKLDLIGSGDIMLLYTDGLQEHHRGEEDYFPNHLETLLREVKDQGAEEICEAIQKDVLAFGGPEDDISFVVIKRT
ncbi:MAG: PP2C family protein-serine/threonine phosphatase [bacterium]|nr:PP2C family protein-serine/threonine phosphatase [bacterium]